MSHSTIAHPLEARIAELEQQRKYREALQEAAALLAPHAPATMGKGDGSTFGSLLMSLESALRDHMDMPTAEEEALAARARRDADRREAQRRRPVGPQRRLRIYRRDDFKCVTCGTSEDLTLDHIVPVSRGGGNEDENLQTMCRSHNSSKGATL